jgi:hydrogenase maturation protease
MSDRESHAPVLIFTYGNPSRGDDALGPAMHDLLEKYQQETGKLDQVELLTDYQLQIEHAVDLEHRQLVIFVDASVSAPEPYGFHELRAERDQSYTTHAMSPVAVLEVFRQISHCDPPTTFLLAIRGYEFELGQDISEQAGVNLQQAFDFISKTVSNHAG